jgi:hypothetical protein
LAGFTKAGGHCAGCRVIDRPVDTVLHLLD